MLDPYARVNMQLLYRYMLKLLYRYMLKSCNMMIKMIEPRKYTLEFDCWFYGDLYHMSKVLIIEREGICMMSYSREE
jgi:hypothetical protein